MAKERPVGGINQRAYVRIPLRLTARLEGEHWLGRVGQIRDYCPGGIFLACEVTGSDPTVGELDAADPRVQATVRFQIDLGSGAVGHTVRARVVRSFEAGLGLAFVDADPATLGALQQLAERQIAETATRTGGNPSIGDPKREAIVRECSALCTVEFGAVIASFCRRAEQQLVLASREATSTLAQQQFFDALNTLEAHQPRVRERFVGLFEQHFSELGQPLAAVEKPSEPLESDSLSLVDKGEFEDFLVVSELSTKLEFSHDLILMSINQRLDNVSDSRILNETNPIGPVAVCHAFRSALHSLQLTDASNQVLYDAFADELAHSLGGIYRVVDGFLGEEGLPATSPYGIKIVPELRSRPSRDRTTSMAGRGEAAHFGQPLSDATVASSGTAGTSDPWGVVPAPLSSLGEAVERIDSAPPPEVDLSDLAAGPGLAQPGQPDGTTHL